MHISSRSIFGLASAFGQLCNAFPQASFVHHTCFEFVPNDLMPFVTATSCELVVEPDSTIFPDPTTTPHDVFTFHGPPVHTDPHPPITVTSEPTDTVVSTVTPAPSRVTVTHNIPAPTPLHSNPPAPQQKKQRLDPSAIAGICILSTLAFLGLGGLAWYLRKRSLRRRAAESNAKAGFFRGLFSRDEPVKEPPTNIRTTTDWRSQAEEHEMGVRYM